MPGAYTFTVLPLPADLALTAASRLGFEMLGSAVLLVGAHPRLVRLARRRPAPCSFGRTTLL